MLGGKSILRQRRCRAAGGTREPPIERCRCDCNDHTAGVREAPFEAVGSLPAHGPGGHVRRTRSHNARLVHAFSILPDQSVTHVPDRSRALTRPKSVSRWKTRTGWIEDIQQVDQRMLNFPKAVSSRLEIRESEPRLLPDLHQAWDSAGGHFVTEVCVAHAVGTHTGDTDHPFADRALLR